jgi:hypothetical protein
MTVVVPIGNAKLAPEALSERVGVLLVNLGTPDTSDARGVRVYLKEFLSDPRVIEDQGLLWKLILNGIILRVRPARKARDYQKIWNTERDESPLKTITRARPKSSRRRSPITTTSWSIGRCATAIRRSARASMRWLRKAATGCWWCRSIRNIRRRLRQPSATRFSACWPACAHSRRCA